MFKLFYGSAGEDGGSKKSAKNVKKENLDAEIISQKYNFVDNGDQQLKSHLHSSENPRLDRLKIG